MIGGISYFHTYAYDLLADERTDHGCARSTRRSRRTAKVRLQKVTSCRSSMVFESATTCPSSEGQEREIPPPLSSYGFQKLAVEYYAKAAHDQYGLPYTIVRPFNCVGIGEGRALGDVEIPSGNVKLAMSHVVPDLVQKVLKGQDPLHILGDGDADPSLHVRRRSRARHRRVHGASRGGQRGLQHLDAQSTTVLELAELIWRKIRGDDPFRVVHDEPFEHDVQKRVPRRRQGEARARLRGDDPARRHAR